MKRLIVVIALGLLLTALAARPTLADDELSWPAITREARPWAFNWWLGSAVDKDNLARELQRYRDGGLGGIHVIPIYGAKGAEARYLDYLSPQWMAMLGYAVSEAGRQGMGVDMTTGTGWCFGGPTVPVEQAGIGLTPLNLDFPADGALPKKSRHKDQTWPYLVALGPDGQRVDLREKIKADGVLDWKPPGAGWKLVGVGLWPTGTRVKRAAPGGAGFMINPFYGAAMDGYLRWFSAAFDGYRGDRPRAMYHDSFEYNSAWTPDLPEEFARRHGYRLEEHWEQLAGVGEAQQVARLWHDYRQTVSDLMVEKAFPQWVRWCRERGFKTRFQAHGSPGNLLDLYALSDIPETEMFGNGREDKRISRFDADFRKGDREPLVSKMASSAAHVTGRPLVSAETGTWLAEHFCETFEEMKCLVDLFFVSGINHVFYHGCVYSPDDAPWPGWLFYAATQMNPRNPLWREAPALNGYIARAQAVLQSGRPDSDVLLYWPVGDVWTNDRPGVQLLSVHERDWLMEQPVGKLAKNLWERGYAFDFISDRQIAALKVEQDRLIAPGGSYRTLVVPSCATIPPETLRAVLELAKSGATVRFVRPLPQDAPGLAHLGERRSEVQQLLASLKAGSKAPLVRETKLGAGRVVISTGDDALLLADVQREAITDHAGVLFIRRRHDEGRHYFIANQSLTTMEGWFSLATPARSVAALDAMTGKTGVLASRAAADGSLEVFLRLEPGQSIILRTFENKVVSGPAWRWPKPGEVALALPGPWHVEFVEGGPSLPKPWQTATPGSWTKNGDAATESFSGTARYATHFDAPPGNNDWLLDLGEVAHVARVRLNGKLLGTLIMHPYRVEIPAALLQAKNNLLEIEVTNLAANRIRYLDRNKIEWRKFHDANVADINYKGFDASQWPVFDSGLMGPVRLRAESP